MLIVFLKSYEDQNVVEKILSRKMKKIKELYVLIYFLIAVELNDAVIFTLQVLFFNLKLKYASYICYCDLTNNKK